MKRVKSNFRPKDQRDVEVTLTRYKNGNVESRTKVLDDIRPVPAKVKPGQSKSQLQQPYSESQLSEEVRKLLRKVNSNG